MNHVFASVQPLNVQRLEQLAPDHFDVIVIDEFHHATASTYRRVIEHFTPKELLGLTATPERMDGLNVQDEFFDGRIAAEMRLWEALENDLLSPSTTSVSRTAPTSRTSPGRRGRTPIRSLETS